MRFKLVVATLAAVFAATSAHAAGTTWLGATGGAGLPIGSFSDQASTGFGIGATGEREINGTWAVGGEISWHSFGGNDDREKQLSADRGVPVDLTVTVLPILAHAKFLINANEQTLPYVKAGLGLYHVRTEIDADRTSSDSETRLGFAVGGGVNFKGSSSVRYGVDALYHYISTKDESSNLITVRGQFLFGVGGP